VIPLASSFAKEDLVAPCSTCHHMYTFSRDGPRGENISEPSQFEKGVYEDYVLSKKKTKRACNRSISTHDIDPILIDLVWCHRNAFYECADEIPVRCPLDQFERAVPGKLYDLSFVSKLVSDVEQQKSDRKHALPGPLILLSGRCAVYAPPGD